MNGALVEKFKKAIGERAVIGPFMKTGDPAFVEAAGYAGMDFVILDMEHGPINLTQMQNNVRAAQLAGALPVIRVRELSEEAVSQALDIGAAGVQIPQVCTPEDARRAVRAAKFHPLGERGACRFVRAARYSATPGTAYFSGANDATLVIIQLEGQRAIDNLDEILAVEGIDIAFIGPYDLSQSLGVPGQVGHPRVVEQMRAIAAQAERAGVAAGVFTDTPAAIRGWRDAGVRYIAHSVDVGIFLEACAEIVRESAGGAV